MTHFFHNPTQSLGNKIIFLPYSMVFLTVVLIGGLNYFSITDIALRMAMTGLAGKTHLMSQHFKSAYDEMGNDAFVVSHTPPILGLIRALRNQDIDPLDGSSTELWRTRLETIFTSVMSARPHYVQMRYIGFADHGRELVRVNRTSTSLQPVAAADLQQKGTEPYVLAGRTLAEDTVYFSEVTYNRERGQIEETRTPTVRTVVPVFDAQHRRFGLIVINANYPAMLRKTFAALNPTVNTLIVNHQGDYLEYRHDGTVSAFEFHDDYSVPPPQYIDKLRTAGIDEASFSEQGVIAYFVRLKINPANPDAFLGVVLQVPQDELLQQVYKTRFDTLLLATALLLAALFFAALITRGFTRPLQNMTRNIIAAGVCHQPLNLPVTRRDEIGDLARAFHNMTDALLESETRAKAVVRNAIHGIITISETGVIEEYNPACVELFGYEAEEIIGKNIKLLMPEPYHSEHDGYLQRYCATGEKKIIGIGREVQGKHKNGHVFPMDLSVWETTMQGKRHFSGIVRDITERKQAEQLLQRYMAALERSNKELDQFAYVASHDLKAPLRVIDNASCWLEEDLAEHLTGENLENMQLLRGRVARMEKLLDDLLEYSRIGRKMDDSYHESIAGNELLQDILLLLSPPEGFTINADPRFATLQLYRMPLQQILLNLISNAIKHHDRDHGTVDVTVEDQGEHYAFAVRDDGPGIAEQFHEQVFEMFQTLKSRDRVEGSGMGLTLIRKQIEVFNGTLTLESAEGAGCTFRFTWPKQQLMN